MMQKDYKMACRYHSMSLRNVCTYRYVYILKIWEEVHWNVNIVSECWDYCILSPSLYVTVLFDFFPLNKHMSHLLTEKSLYNYFFFFWRKS